jgi:hypothetical protein
MTSIHEIFTTFGPQYLQRYATAMPKTHRKVIDAIMACRTEACGIALYQCQTCAESHQLYRSCGNRHCPTCQHHKTQQWLQKQIERQLPGHHFLITFTVPEPLRSFIRQNQRVAYSALFKASSDAIKKLALDQNHIGAGGALSSTDGLWHPSRIDFFLPVKALSKIFRAKFRDQIKQAPHFEQIPGEVWQIDWNVNCQAVSSSEASLKYLAPYVFKVAISNSRIAKVQDRTVLIRYRKPHSDRPRILALEVMEFIRRFLQHVLPTGFMKIRYYGLMNPNCKVTRDHISSLIEISSGFTVDLPKSDVEPRRLNTCKSCGGLLKLRAVLLPAASVLLWSG